MAIAENQNLKSLTIDNSYRYDLVSPVLARLGSNPQLRMLQIRYGNHGETPNTLRNLLLRLRQNGSLYDVVVIDSAFWSSAKHYCRRNQQIPAMLANPQLHDDDNEMGKTDLDFFPKLFEVAKQARGTAPNSILIGLMALRDFVGPLENA